MADSDSVAEAGGEGSIVRLMSRHFCHGCHCELSASSFSPSMRQRVREVPVLCVACRRLKNQPTSAVEGKRPASGLYPLSKRILNLCRGGSTSDALHRQYYGAEVVGAKPGFVAADEKRAFYLRMRSRQLLRSELRGEILCLECPFCGQEVFGRALLHRHISDSIAHSTCPVEGRERTALADSLELLCPGRVLHRGRCGGKFRFAGAYVPLTRPSLATCKTCRMLALFMGKVPPNSSALDFSPTSPMYNFLLRSSRLPEDLKVMPNAYRHTLEDMIDTHAGPFVKNRAQAAPLI